METGGFIISSASENIGNARFTFYRILNTDGSTDESNKVLHCHLYYEFRIALSGSYVFSSPNKSVRISRGDMLMIRPGDYHYSIPKRNGYEEVVCAMSVEQLNGNTDGDFYSVFVQELDAISLCPIPATEKLSELAERFIHFEGTSFKELCAEKMIICEMISELAECIGYSTEKTISRKTAAKDTDTLLDAMVNSRYELSEIAKQLNYSPKHTARIIKEKYGSSLSELRRSRRLKTAKKLLSEYGGKNNYTISQIAKDSGYPSVSSLYREFSTFHGCTPKQYRETVKKAKENEKNVKKDS